MAACALRECCAPTADKRTCIHAGQATPARMPRIAAAAKPEGAVYVAHRTRFGNPFYSGPKDDRAQAVQQYAAWIGGEGTDEVWLNNWCYHRPSRDDIIAALRGKNLCCYCRPDQPCHADVLLRIANQGKPKGEMNNDERLDGAYRPASDP